MNTVPDTSGPYANIYRHNITLPEEVHMTMSSIEIVSGISSPKIGLKKRLAVKEVPRLIREGDVSEGLFKVGFGLHAKQGFSLCKIVAWIVSIETFGLAFVVVWLVLFDKKDLPTAFVPVTHLATLIGVAVGALQLLIGVA